MELANWPTALSYYDPHEVLPRDDQFLRNGTNQRSDLYGGSATDRVRFLADCLSFISETKNGWTIWAKSGGGQTIDANQKIVCRDNFQAALLSFVDWYRGELPSNTALQEAFIRKFDNLCVG